MNKLILWKSASDFAAANIETTNQVDLAQAEVTAFKAQSLDPADFALWSQFTAQLRQQYLQLVKQPTPSSLIAAQAAGKTPAPVSNATAVAASEPVPAATNA